MFPRELFVGDVRVVNNPALDVVLSMPRTSIGGRTVRGLEGETYQARVKTCLNDLGSGDDICGPETTSAEFTLLNEVCRPMSVRAVPGDGIVTIRWNEEPDATEYLVEQEGVADPFTTEDQHYVVTGLTNDTTYRFRVQAEGPLGTSDWSPWYSATPKSSSATRLSALGNVVNASDGDLFKRNDITLSWSPRHDAARYEVRVMGRHQVQVADPTGYARRLG